MSICHLGELQDLLVAHNVTLPQKFHHHHPPPPCPASACLYAGWFPQFPNSLYLFTKSLCFVLKCNFPLVLLQEALLSGLRSLDVWIHWTAKDVFSQWTWDNEYKIKEGKGWGTWGLIPFHALYGLKGGSDELNCHYQWAGTLVFDIQVSFKACSLLQANDRRRICSVFICGSLAGKRSSWSRLTIHKALSSGLLPRPPGDWYKNSSLAWSPACQASPLFRWSPQGHSQVYTREKATRENIYTWHFTKDEREKNKTWKLNPISL